MERFELSNYGIKTHCVTASLHPIKKSIASHPFYGSFLYISEIIVAINPRWVLLYHSHWLLLVTWDFRRWSHRSWLVRSMLHCYRVDFIIFNSLKHGWEKSTKGKPGVGYAHEAHKINALMIMRIALSSLLTLPAKHCLRYVATESTHSKRLASSDGCGSGIRTHGLQVMSLTSCRTALSRDNVRLVWACHQEAVEIYHLGFVESTTTDFPP